MNSVQILGNLGRDPVIRATKTGRSVASFSVAVSRTYTTPQGEQRELTDWINVVAWGPLAEAVGNQLKKGTRVFVEGRISSRSYDAQDGTKRYVTEVVANTIAIPIGTPRNSSYGPQQVSVETVITAEMAVITTIQPGREASREEILDSSVRRPKMKIFRSDMH